MATTVQQTPKHLSNLRLVFLLAGCLILCYSAAFIGSLATQEGVNTWYTTIQKPSFNPPNWVFAPVWTTLYTMMAVSLFYVVRSHHPNKKQALMLFGAQLILNVAWSFLFFTFHLIGLALVEMIVLVLLLWRYYIVAKPIRPLAAYLFIPYIAWVSFATVLTASIWLLN